jgi:LytS/YehU family sensor histidine kinase
VILIVYTAIVPTIILLIFYNYFLIYRNQKIGKPKRARYFYWGLILVPVLVLTIIAIGEEAGEIILAGFGIAALIMVVVIPLSNLFFNKYESVLGQINTLTVRVDQGSANLDFLRSQINPHFLFNALNTLYGTSLQENAERTSEGIQKLGDMMRFMLHENNREKIPVEREKEYLVNYVDLQMLRIKDQENVEIIFQRSNEDCTGEIAPMLLIPFVENAFKHGISLQKKSWVKISLRCLAGSVHLDVNNSIHRAKDDDPEHKASGIGLANVRQRLQLLYPNKHELIIRENEMEYFVHLSIQLRHPHD